MALWSKGWAPDYESGLCRLDSWQAEQLNVTARREAKSVSLVNSSAWYRGRLVRRHTRTPGATRCESCREFHGPVAEGIRRSIPNRDHARSNRARASSFVEGSSKR